MKMISWNVNGLRSIYKKGFMDWFKAEAPEILCIQETKAAEEQVPEPLRSMERYHAFFSSAAKKGYSGVALWAREKPRKLGAGLGIAGFDREGRIIEADFGRFILFNIYFPNGKASPERLQFKLDFYEAFLSHVDGLKKRGKKIIICGDLNTAHRELDLARPRENEKVSGFLPEERDWIDRFLGRGFLDTFRMFNQEGNRYSWWDYKTRARDRNIGWRIDYFFISRNLRNRISSAYIQSNIMGSDHCPVGIEIDL